MARPLDADEEETARMLERTGLARAAARCLTALLRGGSLSALDLAEAAGVSRQDVTPASRSLAAAGLATVESRSGGHRGRPSHRYALARERREAVAHLVASRRAALQDELRALDEIERRLL